MKQQESDGGGLRGAPPRRQGEAEEKSGGRERQGERKSFDAPHRPGRAHLARAQRLHRAGDAAHHLRVAEQHDLAADVVRDAAHHLRVRAGDHRLAVGVPLVVHAARLVGLRDRPAALAARDHPEQTDARLAQGGGRRLDVALQVFAVGEDHHHPALALGGQELERGLHRPLQVGAREGDHARRHPLEKDRHRAQVRGQGQQRVGVAGEHHHRDAVALELRQQAAQGLDAAPHPRRPQVLAQHRVGDVERDHQVAGPHRLLVGLLAPLRARERERDQRRGGAPREHAPEPGGRRPAEQARPHLRRRQPPLLRQPAAAAQHRERRGQGRQRQQHEPPGLGEAHHGALPTAASKAVAATSSTSAASAHGSNFSR
jgi:hypothetical protein